MVDKIRDMLHLIFFFTLSHCKSRAVVILCGTRSQTILAGKKIFSCPFISKRLPGNNLKGVAMVAKSAARPSGLQETFCHTPKTFDTIDGGIKVFCAAKIGRREAKR